LIRKASLFLAAALLASQAGNAFAQDPTSTPESPFAKQIHRLDLGITGVGIYNNTVSGPVLSKAASDYGTGNNSLTDYGSNTFGALITIRYVAKPYFGLELNYGYARYTENFAGPAVSTFAGSIFQVQSKVNEYTIGYIATPQVFKPFGLQPYLGAGAGSMAFKPTPHGGEGEPEQARMAYYYTVGLQQDLSPHFGLRVGFREAFFLDPDFGQNYLTNLKHATTYEPQAGFYLRY
jgi:hypothetical protein